MVVLLDLDNGTHDLFRDHGNGVVFDNAIRHKDRTAIIRHDESNGAGIKEQERPNPNINGFSASLACYPIVIQLARSLDLNSLHALSRTCRQFRANLLQYRKQLVRQTLRCVNEQDGSDPHEAVRENDLYRTWHISGHRGIRLGRIITGKFGACARDLVADCRRCGTVVCRNCTMKPPSAVFLPNRHRRLCSACLAVPLSVLTDPASVVLDVQVFTSQAFIRDPCTCPEAVYLCQTCGHVLSNSDTTYKRIWTWRTRYSTYLGGLGTGIGEGNEGVKCGRGSHCLGAMDIEMEIDCSADDSATSETDVEDSATDESEKAGYLRQEIEGIGGVVKKKVKKRVRVGKTVREYEDERERAEYLGREIRGESRSWCGWCDRVVLGSKE